MPKSWCPHLKVKITISRYDLEYYKKNPFRCVCGRPINQKKFGPTGDMVQEVHQPMVKVQRPPPKGGNFIHGKDLKATRNPVKIVDCRPDQPLQSGVATVLDIEYDGTQYGLALNVTNHGSICQLFGNAKTLEFDSDEVKGKKIVLLKVPGVNNPREPGKSGYGIRIETEGVK